MMKKYRMAILVILVFLCACSPIHMERSQPAHTIGVVLKAMNSQHWLEIRAGMEQAAADHEAELLLLYPDNEQATEEQDELIRTLLGSSVDALLVAPCNSYHTAWFAAQAEEHDILCLTVDTRAYDSTLPYIGADNAAIGCMVADYLAENLGEDSFVGIIAGSTQQSPHIDRITGFQNQLDIQRSAVSVEIRHTDSSFAQGLEQAQLFLSRPDCGALFCTNAVMGLAAAQVQAQLGTDAQIVAVDTQDDALYAVRDGKIDALVTQSGYDIGYHAVDAAIDALERGEEPESRLLSSQLLTQENIAEFIKQYRAEE